MELNLFERIFSKSTDKRFKDYIELKEKQEILKSEVDDLAIEYTNYNESYKEAINNIENDIIKGRLNDKLNEYLKEHIQKVADLKKQTEQISKSLNKLGSDKNIVDLYKSLQQKETFQNLKKSYRLGLIRKSIYENILKAKQGKVHFADALVYNDEGKFLILLRSKNSDFEPNKWCLPGGHIDLNEDSYDASVRELEEETGITLSEDVGYDKIGEYDNDVNICYYRFRLKEEPSVTLQSEEHVDSKWVTWEEFKKLDSISNLKSNLNKLEFNWDKNEESEKVIKKAIKDGLLNKEDVSYIIDIIKGRSGTYGDNPLNRKLKRVGQQYGSKKQEDPNQPKEQGKQEEGKKKEYSDDELAEHAKNASQADLESTIKNSPNPKLREQAHQELKRRESEEHPKKENVFEGGDGKSTEKPQEKKEEKPKKEPENKKKKSTEKPKDKSEDERLDELDKKEKEVVEFAEKYKKELDNLRKEYKKDSSQINEAKVAAKEEQLKRAADVIRGIRFDREVKKSDEDELNPFTQFNDIEKGKASDDQKTKVKKVMEEFKAGTLKDRGGNKVTDRKQAIAIALSEAGLSKSNDDESEEDDEIDNEPNDNNQIEEGCVEKSIESLFNLYKNNTISYDRLLKALDVSKLTRKKVQIKGKDGKIYYATRWVSTETGESEKLIDKKTKVEIKEGDFEQRVQGIIDSNASNIDKIRELVNEGIYDRGILSLLTGASYTQARTATMEADIDPDKFKDDKSDIIKKKIEKEQENNSTPEEREDNDILKRAISVDEMWEEYEMNLTRVIKNRHKFALAYGRGGLGKTYTFTQLAKKYELREYDAEIQPSEEQYDYIVVGGKITTAQVYAEMYRHRNKLIVFDDCDTFLSNSEVQGFLKRGLDTGEETKIDNKTGAVVYNIQGDKESGKIPNSFRFRGRVIAISNLTLNDIDEAVVSRAMVSNLTMTLDETFDKLEDIKDKVVVYNADKTEEIPVRSEARQMAIDILKQNSDILKTGGLNTRVFSNLALKIEEYMELDKPKGDIIRRGSNYLRNDLKAEISSMVLKQSKK